MVRKQRDGEPRRGSPCRVGYRRQANGDLRGSTGRAETVWRGTVDTHPEMIGGPLQQFRDPWIRSGSRVADRAAPVSVALDAISYPMICMDARRAYGRHKKPTDQERQGRRLGRWPRCCEPAGFPRSTSRSLVRHASVKGAVGGRAIQLGGAEALSGQSGAWPPAPVRHQPAIAGWREEIRRGPPILRRG